MPRAVSSVSYFGIPAYACVRLTTTEPAHQKGAKCLLASHYVVCIICDISEGSIVFSEKAQSWALFSRLLIVPTQNLYLNLVIKRGFHRQAKDLQAFSTIQNPRAGSGSKFRTMISSNTSQQDAPHNESYRLVFAASNHLWIGACARLSIYHLNDPVHSKNLLNSRVNSQREQVRLKGKIERGTILNWVTTIQKSIIIRLRLAREFEYLAWNIHIAMHFLYSREPPAPYDIYHLIFAESC